MLRILGTALMVSVLAAPAMAEPPAASFEAETVDDGVEIGYGVVIGEVNGDGKPDILLAEKDQYVWYRNPDWKRFVMAESLTERDHVCIAARDINGDGQVEVAVGAQWNPGNNRDPEASGALFYLDRPDDPTKRWKPIRIEPHEPTIHRIRWMEANPGEYRLIVLPLRARPNAKGVRIDAYRMPSSGPDGEWTRRKVNGSLHMTHNMDTVPAGTGSDGGESLLIAGKEGVASAVLDDGQWMTKLHQPDGMNEGAGEVRAGLTARNADYDWLTATIEPMHGNKIVAYTAERTRNAAGETEWKIDRHVLDDTFKGGHAVWCADFLGIGRDQVVAGWRRKNEAGKVGVKLYTPMNAGGTEWRTDWIDNDGMATEYLQAGDLNGDGKPDIVAAGRATKNLKIYWNRTKQE